MKINKIKQILKGTLKKKLKRNIQLLKKKINKRKLNWIKMLLMVMPN
jgi:hypothetical protein